MDTASPDSHAQRTPARSLRPHVRTLPLPIVAALRLSDPELAIRFAWQAVLGPPVPDTALVEDLQRLARPREIAAGEFVFRRNEPAQHVLVLVRGDVALGAQQIDLPFQQERTVHGPDWLDASSAWLDAGHPCDAIALSELQVLELPRAALQDAMGRHPDLARRFVIGLARQVHALTATTHDLMHKDAEARFAAWLLQRCTLVPGSAAAGVVELHERKRDIAAQLAITPETLSRLLRQLNRKGLIEVAGYTVHVHDVKALQRLAADS